LRRLRSFNYFQPKTVSEAINLLTEHGESAYPLAGGTDLLVQMKRGNLRPTVLVDLKRIEGLDRIEEERGKRIAIGPLTSISAIEASSLIRLRHPVLAEAANVLGSPPLRNLGTLGGNIGRASPASDMVPSLIVLGAQVVTEGPRGKRDHPLEEMFTGPGTTVLSRGELITSISLPERNPHSGAVYLKLGRRQGADCALVGVAVSLTLAPGNIEVKDARVALSAVAPVPLRARKAEGVLRSGPLNEARIKEAAAVTMEECSPMTDMRATAYYRKEMVRVLTSGAISRAWAIAERGDNAS
jgi:CO/xanthine dehydrogenase FAD-binding subunit